MFGKDKEIAIYQLEESSIKIVNMKASLTEPRVLDVIKRDLREVPPEEIAKTIQGAADEINCRRSKALCLVPTNAVTTKNIEIPSLDPGEIRSIIDLQAGRHTPYSREEIIIGYVTIGVFQRNYTKVILVIVNRDVIKNQLAVYEAADIRVEKVLFAPEGISTLYSKILNVKSDEPPIGIINVSRDSTDFVVEYNKTVSTCRSIPIGFAQLIKEGAPAQGKLLAELAKSIEHYQSEDVGDLPETYIIAGDDAKLKEMQPALEEQLKAKIRMLPFLDYIKGTQPVMLKMVSEYSDESFLECIAAAHTSENAQIDLTPEEIKTQRTIEEKGRQVIKTGILSVVLMLLFCGVFFTRLYYKGVYLERLEEEYIAKRKAVEVLDRMARKTRIIKDYINSRMVSLDMMDALYEIIPKEIYLGSVLLEENGVITVQGVSESMSRVFNFVSALEESDLFKSVKTKSTTAKKERGKDMAAFTIMFMLESASDDIVFGEESAEGAADKATAE